MWHTNISASVNKEASVAILGKGISEYYYAPKRYIYTLWQFNLAMENQHFQ